MGENSQMSPADIAALTGNNGMNGGSWIWFLLIFVLLGWGGYGGGRGAAPNPMPVNVATQTDVQNAINNQTINNGLNQIALSSADNNYQTAQLVNAQTTALQQQNYANQINALQGFNSVNQTLQGGFNGVSQQLSAQTNALQMQLNQLGYQMDQCCCSVKTQMLQDRLDDRNRQVVELQNDLSNMRQTQTLLGTSGRYVAWAGTGSQASATVVSS